MPFRYPVNLEVEGRRCVVVGGGAVAEQKVRGLLDAGARVRVVAAALTPWLEERTGAGVLEHIGRPYAPGDLDGALLAIAATDDPEVNAAVFAEGESGRVLVNSVDDIAHCHFSVPSIVRRSDLTLTVSTGGRAPALSKRLREQLSDQFGPEFATVVDVLGEVRDQALAERQVDFATWARRWGEALDDDLIAAIREGRIDQARTTLRRSLSGDAAPTPAAGD